MRTYDLLVTPQTKLTNWFCVSHAPRLKSTCRSLFLKLEAIKATQQYRKYFCKQKNKTEVRKRDRERKSVKECSFKLMYQYYFYASNWQHAFCCGCGNTLFENNTWKLIVRAAHVLLKHVARAMLLKNICVKTGGQTKRLRT